MTSQSILSCIKKLNRPVFTTHELADISGKSLSSTTHALNFLKKEGFIFKIYRGIWGEVGNERLSSNAVISYLFPRHRAYVSFVSALHLYGIIEQIPQVVTLASTVHTKTIRTEIGVFSVHKIAPEFFDGFDWYKGPHSFLIAEPEKALVDSLYLSARKKKQFSYFPELHFPSSFSLGKAKEWAKKIPDSKIRSCVQKRLTLLF
jgi:predicted transcriptional regulator of viral defense system